MGKRGHPGAGMKTGKAGRAEEGGREKAWEGAGVGARPTAPQSLGAAPGSPGTDDPALASSQSMDLGMG